jgi:5'-3' exonuclease
VTPPYSVHLVDGTYELFRAYFAVPSQKSPAGAEVGATRGLMNSMQAFIARGGVTHVACAFDHVIESFRNRMFAGYKTGDGLPVELTSQFELAERAVAALGIVVWPMVEFEADDALATAALRFARDPNVERVVICSPDKDLLQCVEDPKIVCWDRQRDRIYDEAKVFEKLGVTPRQVPDFLALVGDSADGIPGVPRWGKTSAARALTEFGTLDALLASPGQLKGRLRGADALLQALESARADVELYRRLATLRTDVPLAEGLDELAYRGASRAGLGALCSELGAEAVLERVTRWA